MKLLALESSAKAASCAVLQDGVPLATAWQATGLTHSRTLLPMVEDMLKNSELTLGELDAVAVAAGPGSFTGLRIGIATAKGFADLLNIPIVPICSLDALAENYREERSILVPILDARKNQVYAAIYDNRDGKMKKILSETPISPLEELAKHLTSFSDILFFGDAVPGWRERIAEVYGDRCRFGAEEKNGIHGDALIRLTSRADLTQCSGDIMPLYLRGVDAKAKFTDYKISEMKDSDIDELVELDRTAFPRPWSHNMFHSELHNGYGHYWVLRSEGKITAYGGFWVVGTECHITNIAVHEDYRHIGQGRALLEHLLKMAELYGAHGITLEVRPSNTTALSLYRSHGFIIEGTRKHYYEDGENAYIMWYYYPDFSNEKPWRTE